MLQSNMLDMALETEEYITAEEYMRRRENGQINPANVRYAYDNPQKGKIGGFYVKLSTPRYKVAIPNIGAGLKYAR